MEMAIVIGSDLLSLVDVQILFNRKCWIEDLDFKNKIEILKYGRKDEKKNERGKIPFLIIIVVIFWFLQSYKAKTIYIYINICLIKGKKEK